MANEDQKEFLDIPGLTHLWAGLKAKLAKKDMSNVDPATGRRALGIVNPDLGQNDPTAVDFVKNRTHWIEDLIVPYQQYAVDATYHRAIIEQGGLRDGENYTVTWEGTQYECTAIKQNVLYTVLGDDGVVPFKIQASSSRMYVYPTDTTLTAVNMGIKGPGAYRPLSENFLPVIPVAKGGTGASSVAGAQEALGIGGKRTTRLTIGTSTSGWTAKDCDYLCDGTADDVEINAAIDALPEEGGEIVLLDGSYYLADDIDVGTAGVTIRGNGQATKLVRAADGVTMIKIRYGGCTVENLYLEGLIETYTGSSNCGIYIGPDNNIIRGCTIKGNTSYGIQCWGAHNKIVENTITTSYTGINILEDYNVVSNNVVLSNSEHGIKVQYNHNVVTGNVSRLNAVANLQLMSANHCVVVGNDCSIAADDEVTAQYAVQLYRTDNSYNTVTDNQLGSGSITDDGGISNVTGAGLGFGYWCQVADSVKNISENGLWLTNGDTPDGNYWFCHSRHSIDNNNVVVDAWRADGLHQAILCKNGTWGEWEWVNPALNMDVEYRTTERWYSYPVYVKMIDIGALPNNSTKQVVISDNADGGRIIDAWGFENISGQKIPSARFGGYWENVVELPFSGLRLNITTNFDGSSFTQGLITVKYIKY